MDPGQCIPIILILLVEAQDHPWLPPHEVFCAGHHLGHRYFAVDVSLFRGCSPRALSLLLVIVRLRATWLTKALLCELFVKQRG